MPKRTRPVLRLAEVEPCESALDGRCYKKTASDWRRP